MNSTDFPAPLGPAMPKTSPSSTWKSTPFRATRLPKCLVTPSTSRMAMDPGAYSGIQGGICRVPSAATSGRTTTCSPPCTFDQMVGRRSSPGIAYCPSSGGANL